jgi:hypothetical protein
MELPLYARHGFEAIGEIKAGSSPPMVPTLRRRDTKALRLRTRATDLPHSLGDNQSLLQFFVNQSIISFRNMRIAPGERNGESEQQP